MLRYNLEHGKVYNVTHRTWDNKRHVTANRQFLMTEKRFGEILCYVFSARFTMHDYINVVSIPEYDLVEVKKATGQFADSPLSG